MLQPEKKMVPAPPIPVKGGSSPKCGKMDATTGWGPAEQKPNSPEVLSTPHDRGHSSQLADILAASRALSKIWLDDNRGIENSLHLHSDNNIFPF
jgi:hypothetical protein